MLSSLWGDSGDSANWNNLTILTTLRGFVKGQNKSMSATNESLVLFENKPPAFTLGLDDSWNQGVVL